MNLKVVNYLILSIVLAIQVFSFGLFYTGGRSLHGNIGLFRWCVVVYFKPGIKYHNQVVKYILPIALWTTGFFILFQNNYTSISGAILIACASIIEYQLGRVNK